MHATAAVILAVAPAGGLLDPNIANFGMIALMGVAFYVLLIRPQQRRAKEHATRVSQIKRGDTVILSNGIIGKVVRVEDQEAGVEIAQNVTVKVIKSMIAEVRTRGEPAAANDGKA